jgi:hypothetical protein
VKFLFNESLKYYLPNGITVLDLMPYSPVEVKWCLGGKYSSHFRKFSPLHITQTGSGAHSASYPIGTGG